VAAAEGGSGRLFFRPNLFLFRELDIGIKFMSFTRIKIALLCCFWLSHCLIHLGIKLGDFFLRESDSTPMRDDGRNGRFFFEQKSWVKMR
jgi:hypothetical protein